jgi:ketosteroid isomerase-like protein
MEPSMSLKALATEFVSLCNQGKNFDVMRAMYSEDIVSVESTGAQTEGKTAVIQKSERWAAGVEIHGETVVGPYFNGPDQFAVTFTFDVTPKATGKRLQQSEVGVYHVQNGKIVKEVFYNSGAW